MAVRVLLALSTFPDRETAQRISNQVVAEKLAACANILPAVESIYRWKDKVETGNETLVIFKLGEDRQSAFQEKVRSLHPYDSQLFRKKCARFIPTKFPRSSSFEYPMAYPNICTGWPTVAAEHDRFNRSSL